MTEEEEKKLPFIPSARTLMPYSYYRLSDRSGYGAGNKAPAYYELLYEGMQQNDISYAGYSYLSKIAAYQRNYGHMVSSAEVIEAMRLAVSLAELRDKKIPNLRDLTDAAITCMGHGHFSEIALAVADTQIGTKIGSLPEGVRIVPFADRYLYMQEADIIISATSSPHYTVTRAMLEKNKVGPAKRLFVDLAVPRDIDDCVLELQGSALLNMDDFEKIAEKNNEIKKSELETAEGILLEGIDGLRKEIAFHEFFPELPRIKEKLPKDMEQFIYRYRKIANGDELASFLGVLLRMGAE